MLDCYSAASNLRKYRLQIIARKSCRKVLTSKQD